MATVPERADLTLDSLDSEQAETLTPVADVYNTFNEQVVTALNRNLTFSENFRADLRTLAVTAASKTTVSISIGKPAGVWVIGCTNTSNKSYVYTAAPYVVWEWDGANSINIKQVLGLSGSDKFEITLLIIAG
jgi:hypothetical protein